MIATKVFVLWGTRKGDAPWQEQIITATSDKAHLENARAWAEGRGFVNLRVCETFDGDKPNFGNVINK